jgi:hypothetical protein
MFMPWLPGVGGCNLAAPSSFTSELSFLSSHFASHGHTRKHTSKEEEQGFAYTLSLCTTVATSLSLFID